jgi:hypothetical protein
MACCGRRGFERSRRPYAHHRNGEAVQVRRRPQAAACRQRDVEELGKPPWLLCAREVEAYCHRESPPPAEGVSYHASDSEVGQAYDQGKDVTAGRSPHRPLLPDTGGPEAQKPTFLRGRANKAPADKRHRFRELDRCLDAELLLDCWPDLTKEAASGVDHVTADAYAANLQGNIEALVQRLQTKRSRAPWVRRCALPNANGTERP